MENSTTQYSDSDENCGFLNLGFDILSNIFIESMNEELIKVSKIFHEISQTASVQLGIYLKWIKSKDMHNEDCDYDCPFLHLNKMLKAIKILDNHKFVVGLIKNDPFNLFYKCIFRKAIKNQNKKVLEVLLNGSRIKKSRESDDELELVSYEKRQLYIVEPLIDINNDLWCYRQAGTMEIFEIMKNAHKIKIDVEKDHGITSDMVVGCNKYVSIHKPLEKSAMIRYLGQIKKLDLEMVKFYLENVDIDEDSFKAAFRIYSISQCLTIVKFLIEYGIKHQFQLSRSSMIFCFAHNTNEISEYVIEAAEKYMDIYQLMEAAMTTRNEFCINYFLEKGIEIEHNNYRILKFSISRCIPIPTFFFFEKIDLANLDTETQKDIVQIISSDSESFLDTLIDKGIDIHLCKDIILETIMKRVIYGRKEIGILKRVLEFGANVYANKSKLLKLAVSVNSHMALVILQHINKPHPDSSELLELACECGIRKDFEIEKFYGFDPHSKINELVELILSKEEGLAKKNKHLFFVLLQHEQFELCKPFLVNGLSLNNKKGSEILKYAIIEKKDKLIAFLLEWNVRLCYRPQQLFWYACRNQFHNVVETILEKRLAKRKSIEYELNIACQNNDIVILELLLKYSPEKEKNELINFNYGSPLSLATKNGNGKIVDILLSNGANINVKNKKLFLNACRFGYVEIMTEFFKEWKQNGNIDKKILNRGTVLAANNNRETYSMVIQHITDSKRNILSQNTLNQLLTIFCKNGNLDLVKEIVDVGGDVESIDNCVLLEIYELRNIDLFDYLLENGLNKNQLNTIQFIKSCEEGDMKNTGLMLDEGVNINVNNSFGLRIVCEKGNLEMIRFLFKRGAKFSTFTKTIPNMTDFF
ncbi:hypothetical protein BB559_002538 [Furculomyces boomerangus]|uniref:Uncharacterized protein n=1 Tax=Furculomyces boomerangus TaxID=61424 RepID=A0A2T9Y4A8_9FUNG|nr:hypothetical protein BB559_006154 [Furculomyces boomerangus]PVU96019.1 hypothetical protein BB559_002538 [Furculomyces boomerangus]